MRLWRVLFIVALSLLKSEGRNFDRDCFNYTHSANSTAMFGSGSGYLPLLPFMEYTALVNLTHSIANWTSDQDNIGLDVIWTTFFRNSLPSLCFNRFNTKYLASHSSLSFFMKISRLRNVDKLLIRMRHWHRMGHYLLHIL